MEAKKRTYPSAAQKTRLVALVEADEELRRGKFSSSFTKKDGEKRWANFAHELNSIPGCKREWKEWRKTWQDMKTAAKKKSAACRNSGASTGGGPPAPPLSEDVISVLRTVHTSTVYGHTDSCESVVQFEDLPSCRAEVVELSNEDQSKPSLPANPAAASASVVEICEDLPGTSSTMQPLNEVRTGRGRVDESQHFIRSKVPTKLPKRQAAVRRLEESLTVSERLLQIAENKLEIKKTFYDGVLTEMRAQTALLSDISQKLSRFDSC